MENQKKTWIIKKLGSCYHFSTEDSHCATSDPKIFKAMVEREEVFRSWVRKVAADRMCPSCIPLSESLHRQLQFDL